MEFTEAFLRAVAYVFPAYVANASPVLFIRLLGKTTPLDRGALAWDGRRVFGEGKTLEGLLSALACGTLTGWLLYLAGNPGRLRMPWEPLTLSAGAMAGDLLGSFIKRRAGIEPGGLAPLLDQLGFLLLALLLAFLLHGPPIWFRPDAYMALLILTIGLHIGTNAAAYLLGLKERPY